MNEPSPPQTRRDRRRAALALAAVALLALGLRVVDSAPGTACRQYDEYHDIYAQHLPLRASIAEFLADTVGGLAGHLAYRPVLRAFGYSPTAGRGLSIALDLLTLALLLAWCRARCGLRSALCVGTLYAASPTLLSFVCQSRYYALFNLGMTLSYLALIDIILATPRRRLRLGLLFLGGAIVALGHYLYACVWLAAVALAALLLVLTGRRREVPGLALAVAAVGLAALPQVWLYLRQRQICDLLAWSHLLPASLGAYLHSPLFWYGGWVASILLLALVVLAWRDGAEPFRVFRLGGLALALIGGTTAIAGAATGILQIPIFSPGRQEIVFTPLICLVVGRLAAAWRRPGGAILVLALVVLASARIAAHTAWQSYRTCRPDPAKLAFLERHLGDAHLYDYACTLKYELTPALRLMRSDRAFRSFFRYTEAGRRRMLATRLEHDLTRGREVLLVLPGPGLAEELAGGLAGAGYEVARPPAGALDALIVKRPAGPAPGRGR